jgi:Arc-like DNA binding domain
MVSIATYLDAIVPCRTSKAVLLAPIKSRPSNPRSEKRAMPERAKTAYAHLKVRMKEPLRADLEEVARDRGVSMNAEIVRRLEWSLAADEQVEAVFGSAELYGVMRALAAVMNTAGNRALWLSGHDLRYGWIDSPYAYDQAMQAAVRVLEALRPPGEIEQPPPQPEPEQRIALDRMRSGLGVRTADDILGLIPRPEPDKEEARRRLGRLADRLSKEPEK